MTTTDATSTAGAYADVNGLHLYYETHGSGRPLILIHGGLGTGDMFGPVRAELAANHQVITPDLQGHGRTADIDRPLDVRLMADDIAALIRHLGLDKPDLVGYSLGGGVALMTAIKHRSSSARSSSRLPISNTTPSTQQCTRSRSRWAPRPPMPSRARRCTTATLPLRRAEDFPRLLDKVGASMKKPFDFTEEVRGVTVPTLIIAADADMAPPSHYVEFFKLLDGGLRDGGWMGEGRPKGGHALAILPGLTHYNLGISPLFSAVTLSFLDRADT